MRREGDISVNKEEKGKGGKLEMSLVFVKCKLLLNFNGLEENIEIIYSVVMYVLCSTTYVHGLGDPFQVTTEKHLF